MRLSEASSNADPYSWPVKIFCEKKTKTKTSLRSYLACSRAVLDLDVDGVWLRDFQADRLKPKEARIVIAVQEMKS